MTLQDIGAWASKTFAPQQSRNPAPRQKKPDFLTQVQQVLNPIKSPVPTPQRPQMYSGSFDDYANRAQQVILTPLAGAQSWIESSSRSQVVPTFSAPKFKEPGLQTLSNLGTGLVNIGGGITNTVVGKGVIDPSVDVGRLIGKTIRGESITDYNELKSAPARLAYNLSGYNASPQQLIGNIAGTIEAPLTAYSGGKVFGIGKNAAQQVGKQALKDIVIQGSKKGAKMGFLYGLDSGLAEGRNAADLKGQLVQGALGAATGTAGGAVLGGGIAGVGYVLGKGFNRMIQAYQNTHGGNSDVSQRAVDQFLRDERGRFKSGFKPNPKEPAYYGDMRESLGLPRNGDYTRIPRDGTKESQAGFIDFKKLMYNIEHGSQPLKTIKKEPTMDQTVQEIVRRHTGPDNLDISKRQFAAEQANRVMQENKFQRELFKEKGATYIDPKRLQEAQMITQNQGGLPMGMSTKAVKGSPEVHAIEQALKENKIGVDEAKALLSDLEVSKNIKIVPNSKLGLAKGTGMPMPPKGAPKQPYPWSEWDDNLKQWVDPSVPSEMRTFKGEQFTKSQMKQNILETEHNADIKGKEFKSSFSRFIGKRNAAETTALEQTKDLAIPKGVNGKDLIKQIETPSDNAPANVQAYINKLRAKYDEVYRIANKEGIDIGYRENYLTHTWNKPADEVARMYQGARQNFPYSGERKFPTYEEGIKMGLTPKYSDPQQIIANYISTLEKTKANIEFIQQLRADRLIVPKRGPGLVPISAPGFPAPSIKLGDGTIREGVYYASPKIADNINKVFSEQSSILSKPAKLSGAIQDISLSGGVPRTPLNAWTFAQTTKEVLSGRVVGPLKALVKSVTPGGAAKYFKENSQFIKEQQLNDIPINTTYNIDSLGQKSTVTKLLGKDLGDVWHKTVNEPTFKKFMPILQTEFYKDTKNTALKSGLDEAAAQKIAAEATRNWYGITSASTITLRNQLLKDTLSTFTFAPRYRETMINFWWNNLKSIKNPLALENRANVKFLIGAITTYGIYDQLNRHYNNGRAMNDNPPGTEDKLLIPTADGTIIGVPFLSSIATIPRAAIREGKMIVAGDIKGAFKDAAQTYSSMMIKPLFDVATNQDYFGKNITEENQTPNEKRAAQASYLVNQYVSHPYLRELFDKRNNGDPIYQRISRAMEAPFRFYTQAALDAKEYFAARDNAIKGLNSVEQSALASIPKSDSDNPQTRITKYNLFLSYPKVFEAKQKIELETAAKTNKAIDPLYLFDYDMVKKYMTYEAQPEGGQERKDLIKAYPEILAIIQARSKFFEENPIPGQSNTSKRPEPSDYVQQQMDAKNWKDPEVRAYLDANTAWNNGQREKLGLPPLAGFQSFSKFPKKPKKVTFKKVAFKKAPAFKIKGAKLAKLKLPKQPKVANIKIKTPKNLLTKKIGKSIKIKDIKLA